MSKQPGGGHHGHGGQGGHGGHHGSASGGGSMKHGGGGTGPPTKHHRKQKSPGGPGKHTPHHHHQQPTHHKHPGMALTTADVSCCMPLALAESARIYGFSVSDYDAIDLYFSMTEDMDSGVPVLSSFISARDNGLGNARLAAWQRIDNMAGRSGDVQMLRMPSDELHMVTIARSGLLSWRNIWLLPSFSEILETWTLRWS